jgi:hypothetical protein
VIQRTQVERVVAAARAQRGITQVDFLGPDTIDGGNPITRLAARVWDAEQQGYSFESTGKRQKCTVYHLVGEPSVGGPVGRSPAFCESEKLVTSQQADGSLDDQVVLFEIEGPHSHYLEVA